MLRINVGCGEYPAKGWINLDTVRTDIIKPDRLVDPHYPFEGMTANSVDYIYAGHCLEHMYWDKVPHFLTEAYKVLKPEGELLVVGPDIFKAMSIHAQDPSLDNWRIVIACLEDDKSFQAENAYWPENTHKWNCYEARLELILGVYFGEVITLPVTRENTALDGWPVTSFAPWQCAILARKVSN